MNHTLRFGMAACLVSGVLSAQTSPSPTNQKPEASTSKQVEVLSDTHGVDFGPYLQRVLHDVKMNWYSLIPENARPPIRKKGKVSIEFAILKDGHIAGMRFEPGGSSGDVALDRAAWGGITASDPFLPLPAEFHGPNLALRFHFFYNSGPATPSKPWVDTSIVPLEDGASPPRGIRIPGPLYPQGSINSGKQGKVIFSLIINKHGDVRHLKVLQKADPELDRVAQKTIKDWKFQPVIRGGKATDVPIKVEISFHLPVV